MAHLPLNPDWIEAIDGVLSQKQLAKLYGLEASTWIIAQRELRIRATKKFGTDAAKMLFDREALEQATHPRVSEYHASRFPKTTVWDLTAGIGGDLKALANHGSAVGFEILPDRRDIAAYNVPGSEVRLEDGFAAFKESKPDYVWADPHRRISGKRLIDPEDYQPNPTDLAELMRATKISGMKLSPMIRDEYLDSLGGRVEFISHLGECCEALIWLGSEVEPGWEAVHIESGERLERFEVEDEVQEPEQYLFDADPAAVRAHVLGNFQLPQLGEFPGYLTGPDLLHSPWLRTYEVLYHGPGDLKTTKRVLRENGWSVFEVKQRGTGLDVPKILKELKIEGDPVSLVAFLVGKSVRFCLVRRVA